MFTGLLLNSLDQISIVEKFVEVHDKYESQWSLSEQGLAKTYAMASCVTRLYAIYEHFVETVLSDYLDALPEIIPFANLPDVIKIEYRIGISHILNRIDGERYGNLSYENIISWYHQALTDTTAYKLVTQALTRHEQNLRLGMVELILSRVDLKDFRLWLARAPAISDLYDEKLRIAEQLDAELIGFIQLRNDAAHGSLQILYGKDYLLRYCALIRAVVSTLVEYFHKKLLELKANAGQMRKIGQVTNVYKKANAFVVQIEQGCELRLGMPIHFVSDSTCVLEKVKSLRVDDKDVESVIADKNSFEVGLQVSKIPKISTEIFVDVFHEH